MNTTRTTRMTAMAFALLMTATINGAMLWEFNSVAQDAALSHNSQPSTTPTLARATVAVPQS